MLKIFDGWAVLLYTFALMFGRVWLILPVILLSCQAQAKVVIPAHQGENPKMSTLNAQSGQNARVRYLALGDSYTSGESVAESERWPVQLVERLRQQGFDVEDAQIVAHNGWSTGDLAAGIEQAGINPPYDLVSLLIGVNNQFRGYSREDYREEFAALLEQSIAFADGNPQRVFVLSIPDWGMTPFAGGADQGTIAADIDAFNAINRAESERRGVYYIDITPLSRQANGDLSLIAEDGLHPSGKMYTGWVELALPAAVEALEP